jgi:hypothetical protein
MWLVPFNIIFYSFASRSSCVASYTRRLLSSSSTLWGPKISKHRHFLTIKPHSSVKLRDTNTGQVLKFENHGKSLSSNVTVSDWNHIAACCGCGIFMRHDNCSRQGSHCGEWVKSLGNQNCRVRVTLLGQSLPKHHYWRNKFIDFVCKLLSTSQVSGMCCHQHLVKSFMALLLMYSKDCIKWSHRLVWWSGLQFISKDFDEIS